MRNTICKLRKTSKSSLLVLPGFSWSKTSKAEFFLQYIWFINYCLTISVGLHGKQLYIKWFLPHFQRNLTFSCVDTHTFPVFFNGTSFLQLPGRRDHNMVSVGFQFRTWNPSGLLLFSSLADGMLELALNNGKVTAHINVTQQKNMHVDISSGELTFFPHTDSMAVTWRSHKISSATFL